IPSARLFGNSVVGHTQFTHRRWIPRIGRPVSGNLHTQFLVGGFLRAVTWLATDHRPPTTRRSEPLRITIKMRRTGCGGRVVRRCPETPASGNPLLGSSGWIDPLGRWRRGGPIGVVKLLRARGGCLGVISFGRGRLRNVRGSCPTSFEPG